MPLIKSKSKKAFSKNVETEMEHGKPQKQSIAIAYSMKKRAKKARGGYASAEPGYGVECAAEGGVSGGGGVKEGMYKPSGYSSKAEPQRLKEEQDAREKYKKLYKNELETPRKNMSEGGDVDEKVKRSLAAREMGVHKPTLEAGQSQAGFYSSKSPELSKAMHKNMLREIKSQKTGYFAEGGVSGGGGVTYQPLGPATSDAMLKHNKIAKELNRKPKKMAEGGDPVDPIQDSRLQSHAHECEMCGHTNSNEEHESDRHDSAGEPMMAEGGEPQKKLSAKESRDFDSYQPGINFPFKGGTSVAGKYVRSGQISKAKDIAKSKVHELQQDKQDRRNLAEGGQITDNYNSPSTRMHQTHDGDVDPQDNMTAMHQGNAVRDNESAEAEAERKLNQHGAHEEGRQGNEGHYAEGGQITDNYADTEDGDGLDMVGQIMAQRQQEYAEGGEAKYTPAYFEKQAKQTDEMHAKRGTSYGKEPGVHSPSYSSGKDKGQSIAGDLVRSSPYYKGEEKKAMAKDEHKRVLGEIKSQKTGYFSEGGQVANDTDRAKDMTDPRDDAGSGRYDDLVNRDDDMEDADYTGANSGDELSDEREDYDRKDIVSQIMKSRKKKDRLPNPR